MQIGAYQAHECHPVQTVYGACMCICYFWHCLCYSLSDSESFLHRSSLCCHQTGNFTSTFTSLGVHLYLSVRVSISRSVTHMSWPSCCHSIASKNKISNDQWSEYLMAGHVRELLHWQLLANSWQLSPSWCWHRNERIIWRPLVYTWNTYLWTFKVFYSLQRTERAFCIGSFRRNGTNVASRLMSRPMLTWQTQLHSKINRYRSRSLQWMVTERREHLVLMPIQSDIRGRTHKGLMYQLSKAIFRVTVWLALWLYALWLYFAEIWFVKHK